MYHCNSKSGRTRRAVRFRALVLGLTVLAVLVGCAQKTRSEKDDFPNSDRRLSSARPSAARTSGKIAFEKLKKRYGEEWAFNEDPGARDRPPQLGIALSGGGTRSASFSLGILKALHEHGLLSQFDILSSVSGGSYAAMWYYSQNLLRDGKDGINAYAAKSERPQLAYSDKTLFKVDYESPMLTDDALVYRFQTNLEKSSNILYAHHQARWLSPILNFLELSGKPLLHIPTIPMSWVTNLVFDGEYNKLNFNARYYRNGLERTYAYAPLDFDQKDYFNDNFRDNWLLSRISAKDTTFDEIRCLLEQRKDNRNDHLPFLVVNATGWRDKLDPFAYDDPVNVSDRIFEFTPLHAGSDQFGYHNHKAFGEVALSTAVALSGAAVDLQQPRVDANGKPEKPGFWQTLGAGFTNALNLDLGGYVVNPNTLPEHRIVHKLLPFPLYYLDDWLFLDRDDDWETPGREDSYSTKIYLNDGGKSENLGAFSLIRRGVENVVIVDAAQDSNSEYGDLRTLAAALRNDLGLKFKEDGVDFGSCDLSAPLPTKRPNVQQIKPEDAVMCAKLVRLNPDDPSSEPIPFYEDPDGNKVNAINLFYVKLSLDRDGLKKSGYSEWVKDYARTSKKFPHQSTADIFYSTKQYRAYRDLGARIGCELVQVLLSEKNLNLTPDVARRGGCEGTAETKAG